METYRTLANTMSYVDMRESIPSWARGYAVGDTMYFRAIEGFVPYLEDGEITTATVAGFCSSDSFEGLPVIVSPTSGHPTPVPEHRHVTPAEGKQYFERD